MMLNKKAKKSFRFYTTSSLVEITGKVAHHLKNFISQLKTIDEACLFYHTHRAFREYTFAPGQYSNDFARWVGEDLEESRLAERLAAIDLHDFTELEGLRQALIKIVEEHLTNATEIRMAPPSREFYFLRGIDIVAPTKHIAHNLNDFIKCLDKVAMRSLYYHFFDARLRLGRKTNDFSQWIEESLGEAELAKKINQLDPYFLTMDQLKHRIIDLCKAKRGFKWLS